MEASSSQHWLLQLPAVLRVSQSIALCIYSAGNFDRLITSQSVSHFCPYPYHNNTYKVTGKGTVVHPDHGSRIDLWSAVLPFNPLVPISSHNSGFLLMTALFSQVERTVRSFSQTSINSTSGHASGNSI